MTIYSNITNKLAEFYSNCQFLGYIPSTVGVSDEEYKEYNQTLKEMAEVIGLVWTDTPKKLTYKGIELVKYGKQHRDEKRKKTSKND